MDLNGSVRDFFGDPAEYVGVDLIVGKGVDLVHNAADAKAEWARHFDVAISTECFEHNPDWAATFANMASYVRHAGLVLMTCASTGRDEHGTRDRTPEDSPGTLSQGWNYYKNLREFDFQNFPLTDWFFQFAFEYSAANKDLYFWGIRR